MPIQRPRQSSFVFAIRGIVAVAFLLTAFCSRARCQSNEVGAFIGGVASQTRNISSPGGGNVQVSPGFAAGGSVDHGFARNRWLIPHVELGFTVLPPRNVRSASAAVPQSYDALFVTAGLRMEFLPRAIAHPWLAAGGGYTLFIQSQVLTNGHTYSIHLVSRPVGDFGGGIDFRLWNSKHRAWVLALRGQVRDFVSGTPQFNAPLSSSVMHNVVASGGLVFSHQSVYFN